MLGKVAISCEELKTEPVREDRWYPIKPIDADSEVQVSLCARLLAMFYDCYKRDYRNGNIIVQQYMYVCDTKCCVHRAVFKCRLVCLRS